MKSSRKTSKKQMTDIILSKTEAVDIRYATSHMLDSSNSGYDISPKIYNMLYDSLCKLIPYVSSSNVYMLYSKLVALSGGCSELLEVSAETYRDMVDRYMTTELERTGRVLPAPKQIKMANGKRVNVNKHIALEENCRDD